MPPRVTSADVLKAVEAQGSDIRHLAKDVTELKEAFEQANGRQRRDHDEIIALKANLSTTAKVQATLTLIGSVLAAAIGVNINR